MSTKGRTRPGATTKEDKAKIPSTKSQTNSKLQAQMTKTEDGGEKTNHEAHEGHEEDSWTGKTERIRPTTKTPRRQGVRNGPGTSARGRDQKTFQKEKVLPACSTEDAQGRSPKSETSREVRTGRRGRNWARPERSRDRPCWKFQHFGLGRSGCAFLTPGLPADCDFGALWHGFCLCP